MILMHVSVVCVREGARAGRIRADYEDSQRFV